MSIETDEIFEVVDRAVLVAVRAAATGHRRVLGVSVSLSEAEVHWRTFMHRLIQSGLRSVNFIARDDYAGLQAARKAMLPCVPWQSCQFHLLHNAQGHICRIDQRKAVARQLRSIFAAPDVHKATRLLNITAGWTKEQPKLDSWEQINIPGGFTVCGLHVHRRTRCRGHD